MRLKHEALLYTKRVKKLLKVRWVWLDEKNVTLKLPNPIISYCCQTLTQLTEGKQTHPHLRFGLDAREGSDIKRLVNHRHLVSFVLLSPRDCTSENVSHLQDAWIDVYVYVGSCEKDMLRSLALGPHALIGNKEMMKRVIKHFPKKGLFEAPFLIAHRGLPLFAMENTKESFQAAVNQGVDAIEMDVHLSQDNKIVVNHDATLSRLHFIDASISHLTLDAITHKTSLSSLHKILSSLKDFSGSYFIEIKPNDNLLADTLLTLIEKENLTKRVRVISFHLDVLKYVVSRNPLIQCAVLLDPRQMKKDELKQCMLAVNQIQAGVSIHYKSYHKMVKFLRNLSVPLFVWTVNEKKDMLRLMRSISQGITTDHVDVYGTYPRKLIKKKDNYYLVYANKKEAIVHPYTCVSSNHFTVVGYNYAIGKSHFTFLTVEGLL